MSLIDPSDVQQNAARSVVPPAPEIVSLRARAVTILTDNNFGVWKWNPKYNLRSLGMYDCLVNPTRTSSAAMLQIQSLHLTSRLNELLKGSTTGGVKMVEMVIFEHGKHNDTIERKIRPRLPLEY